MQVEKIAGKKITVVPILRAGIGMLDGVLSLVPGAKVSAVGVARNEETLEAHTYGKARAGYQPAPGPDHRPDAGHRRLDGRHHRPAQEGRLQRDPRHGPVAAPEGIAVVEKAHPDVQIYTASIDQRLNEHGYIVPGLGDAGDKIFGTKQKDA